MDFMQDAQTGDENSEISNFLFSLEEQYPEFASLHVMDTNGACHRDQPVRIG